MDNETGSSWGWYIFIFIIFFILLIVLGVDVYYWGKVSEDTTPDTASDLVNSCGISTGTASFLYWLHIIILVIFILIIIIAIFYWAFFSEDDEAVVYASPQDNVLVTQTDTGMVNTNLDFVGKNVNGKNVYRAAESTINTPADINVNVQQRKPPIQVQQAPPQYVMSPQPVLVQQPQSQLMQQQQQPVRSVVSAPIQQEVYAQPQYLVQPQRLGAI